MKTTTNKTNVYDKLVAVCFSCKSVDHVNFSMQLIEHALRTDKITERQFNYLKVALKARGYSDEK